MEVATFGHRPIWFVSVAEAGGAQGSAGRDAIFISRWLFGLATVYINIGDESETCLKNFSQFLIN